MIKQYIMKYIKQLQSDRFWRNHDEIIAKFKQGKRLASFRRHSKGGKAGRDRIRLVKEIKAANNDVRYLL